MQLLKTLSLTFLFFSKVISLSYLGEDGLEVDNWSIIKSPSSVNEYIYATELSPFTHPSTSLNDTNKGALSKTIKQLWNTDVSYVIYNDESPLSPSYNFSVGHTKGFFALETSSQTGFYISHSIPNFPLGPSSSTSYTGLPSNAWTYGQNLFCLSLHAPTLDLLSYGLQYQVPNIYDFHLTNDVIKQYQNISLLTQGNIITESTCDIYTIYSQQNIPFTFFTKTTLWNQDLWSDCVAPFLQKSIVVESWLRGSEIGPSCDTYQVLDIQEVNFGIPNFSWSEYDDHSKWAASTDSEINCFGDINRMTTQFERGGGAICFESQIYKLYEYVISTNTC